MDKFAKLFPLIMLIPGVVKSVEAMRGAGNGADKKAAAMDLINSAFAGAGLVAPGKASTLAAIQTGAALIVDGTVKIFNATGVFKGTAPAK